MKTLAPWLCTGTLVLLLAAGPVSPRAEPQTQQTYATPDEAVAALVDAVKQGEAKQLESVLGPGSGKLVNSGDPIADSEARARFLADYADQHKVVADGTGRMTLDVGPNSWPMPIPLVKAGERWRFDATAGAQEILDRRIGRNEIAAIRSMLAYVAGQKAYYALAEAHGHAAYAQRLVSSTGRHDGLYWPAAEGQEPSPLEDFVAQAMNEGYPLDIVSVTPVALRGYHYRILTAQGPDAPGGAESYIDRGRMTGGFALVAWPARYGASGIMTFIVNQDGVVFQKNLGRDTNKIVPLMQRYDPDLTWARIDVVGQ
jgi:hypothetical protein